MSNPYGVRHDALCRGIIVCACIVGAGLALAIAIVEAA